MQKLGLILTFLLVAIFTNAQKQNNNTNLDVLFEQAKTEFKNITGNKKSEENGIAIYACTQKSELGELGDIVKDIKTGNTMFYMFLNYNGATENFRKELDEYITAKFPDPEYYVFRDEDDDFEEIAVYSNVLDPTKEKKQHLLYSINTDPKTKKETFELIIYGASAQKIAPIK